MPVPLPIVLSLAALADAPEAPRWRDEPIDPTALTTGTAFTVDKKHWHLGLVNQDYGLLTNTSIGISAPLFLLGVPNAHAKVTAIQTPKFHAALQGGWNVASLEPLGVPGGSVHVTPIAWTASWTPLDTIGVHFGTGWTLASAKGTLTAQQIGEGIAEATGADITADLVAALGADGGLYAGANLALFRTHFQFEYRVNRRDSFIFTSNAYVHLSGLVAAGVAIDDPAASVEVGASARLSMPLRESLPALTSVSWQWSWRRFHLRVGLPLPLENAFAWFQAVDMYWVLGPTRKKTIASEHAAPPAPPVTQ